MKHVQHVGGRWIARMTIPDELRAILNMRELVAPLGTDKKQAERQALAVLNRFHAILDEAREASGQTMARSSSPPRCGTESPPLVPEPPISSRGRPGRSAIARASTPSSATNCSTGKSSTLSKRPRS